MYFPNYVSGYPKIIYSFAQLFNTSNTAGVSFARAGAYRQGTDITSITIFPTSSTFSSGTVRIYGVK
jgi:hypothetical protein